MTQKILRLHNKRLEGSVLPVEDFMQDLKFSNLRAPGLRITCARWPARRAVEEVCEGNQKQLLMRHHGPALPDHEPDSAFVAEGLCGFTQGRVNKDDATDKVTMIAEWVAPVKGSSRLALAPRARARLGSSDNLDPRKRSATLTRS